MTISVVASAHSAVSAMSAVSAASNKATVYLADIPSPTKAQYHLGPIPIRMYAMCILAGILVAVWYGDKRWFTEDTFAAMMRLRGVECASPVGCAEGFVANKAPKAVERAAARPKVYGKRHFAWQHFASNPIGESAHA